MEFLPEKINQYAEAHTSPESDVLAGLNRETQVKVLMPRMLSGHLQGRALALFSRMIRPSRILEIGTYTGYSAICLAEGLTEEGLLYTLDKNEELAPMVRRYIEEAGYQDQIQCLLGDAREVIPTLKETFDLVFIDADKVNYGHYYDLIFDQLRTGGFIIADNVLWSGKVAEEVKENDAATRALQAFNDKVQQDKRVENLLLPLRDGLMIVQKIAE
ncbi:MAG: O-methyltransferase [Thermonemataceae bacterium]